MVKSKIARIDSEFESDMRKIMQERYNKGLAKFNMRDLGTSEATRLLRRTDNYSKVLEELRTKPKRANV